MALDDFRTGNQRRNLLLLAHLPIDIGFNIRMVGIHHHHLGGAAGCTAGLDGTGGAIANF